VEYFRIPRSVLTICLGKSTYARCGIIVNVTPLEPEWEGHVTLEFSNTTPLPAKIYANEGVAQILFFESDEVCETSYGTGAASTRGSAASPCPSGMVRACCKPRASAAQTISRRHPGLLETDEYMRPEEPSILIENVHPELNCGRYPVKREVGDALEVTADILKHGHDVLAAVIKYREASARLWREVRMRHLGNDLWVGLFPLAANTRYLYTIQAWTDHFETWRESLGKRIAARQDLRVELLEGAQLVDAARKKVTNDADRRALERLLENIEAAQSDNEKSELLQSENLRLLMQRYADRSDAANYGRELEVVVDRVAARYASWYEMFPRSQGTTPGVSATFKDCEARLPDIQAMGFDLLYLVPIHPIGRTHRKGPNNRTQAGPDDPGSPYAIGGAEGGHTAVHPELGTLEDFRAFVQRARELDMEVALDIAIQCSPDHPYIKEHPDWFRYRPDGTVRYAENPPKKYQDIVNIEFRGPHQESVWQEWRDVIAFWIDQGVKTFRVDNPHTKPIPFWEWLIRDVQEQHPEVVFLAEAFTRPKLLKALAKAGFTQSYTYFTWRNFKQELIDYLHELTQGDASEYLRPHFFTNTPDILPDDPLWYKDAIIYELHVKAFLRQQRRRHRRFPGAGGEARLSPGPGGQHPLAAALLSLAPCGTTATTSPITATSTPPTATRADVRHLIREAHRRGCKVITELVINHTSDQHPWFQAARRRRPARASGISTSGATATRSFPRRASSSPIARSPTGPGTRWPRPTTGTASSPTSRTSTSTTRRW
jgi:starch synthase (maltosyl-transferring)